ncbi:MAG: hypothetical protein ACLQLC_19220 [Candidatus Sulfotelmatobacter sp.]
MNLSVLIVIAAVAALVVILGAAVTRSLRISGKGAAVSGELQPIDVEAFRNLIDAAEDRYLRLRLPPAQFRLVRRERLLAMAAYVQVAADNATVLLRAGRSALASGDPRLAEAAHQLVNDALALRLNAIVALARIYVEYAWPMSGIAAAPVVARYQSISGTAMLLGRLQNPSIPVRVSARF